MRKRAVIFDTCLTSVFGCLFELLFALSILSFLGIQQTGQFLLLLAQHVLLELLLLSQDRLRLKREKMIGLLFFFLISEVPATNSFI